ncbi:bifunctional 2-methylcitrate synthase/citrate synthase [Jiulongibacter sediminis]|jgi:2-methylcitrate synthase|uniref:bifunctional 2-methylcitrate synthase/citrate synthase n=1 Tax=Jiulongibacter sediminis TaxID=1605367 RepID=UPI0026F1DCB3|nr:bifunctional 2-methylcitrate synthase/citrate synthase [Jiulongibacter sediminis]
MEQIFKGLAGVVVDTSSISKVMPKTNSLTYRGYAVEELCEYRDFLDVAYLLVHGELPDKAQKEKFMTAEQAKRGLSKEVLNCLQSLPTHTHPMDSLRTGISILGCEDERIWDNSHDTNLDKYLSLLANIPCMIAASYRHKIGELYIRPDRSLSFSENFFQMCFGEVPAPEVIKAFDVSLILYAEHSFNASTFTARVITSTTSDIYSAVTGAIGALKGPLHGGANEMVMHMLKEINQPGQAEEWMLTALQEKRKIMGFGHRVYKNGDSRVPTMKKYARKMADFVGEKKWIEISDILEKVMIREKNIYPNLDFPAGPAYYMMGFEIEMFTPIFVMSRIAGWTANILEQNANNKLIRPLSSYDGVPQRKVLPL